MLEKEINDMLTLVEWMWDIVAVCDQKNTAKLRSLIKKLWIGDATAEWFNDLADSIDDWLIANTLMSNWNQLIHYKGEYYLFWEDEVGTFCKSMTKKNTIYSKNIWEFNQLYNLYD